MSTLTTPQWLRGDELADMLGVSPGMVRKLLAQGMPSMTIGRARRYDPAACVAWLSEHGADDRQESP